MAYTLGRTPVLDYKYSVGIAYVALPTDLTRERYIKDCYQNYTVSVWAEDGSFMNRVPITPEVLSFIEFPENYNNLGSPVVYVTEESQSQPIIIGRFPSLKNIGDMREAEFKIGRSYKDAHVEIMGSPKSNCLSLNVNSGDAAGSIFINLVGRKPGKLQVSTVGDVEFTTSEGTTFTQQQQFKTVTKDRSAKDESNDATFEQLPGQHNFKNRKFIINNGNEPFVLGKLLKTFLSDLIDEISKSTVSTAIGQQPLLNAAQIAAFKKRTDEFLSIVAYINE